MARCLQLASLGQGAVAPNPMVGAVIVHGEKIIGEGYHKAYGGPHAEVNAVHAVDRKELLSESTIYVSLEPCSHFGKTPPCADLLIQHRFKRVVIASQDPNKAVNGRGIDRLRAAGIEVITGVLEKEARELNRHFYTFHEQRRPFILLKWAQTPNGLMDNAEQEEGISWISGPETQQYVHRLRATHQAILVGKHTVLKDNPRLTVREAVGQNPLRIVLDSHLEIPSSRHLLADGSPTWVVNTVKNGEHGNTRYLQVDKMEITQILNLLFKENVQSALVEGGRQTLQSFIDTGLWDEARIILGQHEFESGTAAPTFEISAARVERLSGDTIYTVRKS